MSVVLADRDLSVEVRGHPWTRDARGVPMPTADDQLATRGPFPGAAKEQPDGSWSLRLDPQCWPIEAGDKISDGTRTWVAVGEPKLHAVPGVPDVDYVAATGTLDPPEVP